MSDRLEYVLVSVKELQQMAEDIRYLKKAINRILEDKDDTWSTEDVMEFLNCSARTVFNYRERGELKYYKRGRKIWFKKEEVIDFMNRYNIQVKENY